MILWFYIRVGKIWKNTKVYDVEEENSKTDFYFLDLLGLLCIPEED